MRPKGSASELERRRQRAIALLVTSQRDDPNILITLIPLPGTRCFDSRTWCVVSCFLLSGESDAPCPRAQIERRRLRGRPPKLGRKQHPRLERLLLKGAKAAGYESDLWTCPRIAEVISAQFGVVYHRDHIGRLLRSLGWSPQRPQRRALERNEERIQGWVREDWPRIRPKF